ncbi:MAG TPA: RluA family pseudouridine synthase [Firmicutes bacterium]|nr:RluA family pseudouridine synthase [Bacillota bacterium]
MAKKYSLLKVTVKAEHQGYTAAEYLKKIMGISNRQLQKIVRTKGVYRNGRAVHSKTKLKSGDQLQAFLPRREQIKIPPALSQDLAVLYEDGRFLAVNKPAGQPSYSTQGGEGLANHIVTYFKAQGQSITPRPIHRLDQPTSGVVLFAKSAPVQAKMSSLWQSGGVQRFYWALCHGRLDSDLEIKTPLEGKAALTKVTPLRIFPDFSEIMLELVTGRTHQIRRHLLSIGHPLLGDERYGKKPSPARRLALHASQVSFQHPYIEKRVEIVAPTPFCDFPFLQATDPPLP